MNHLSNIPPCRKHIFLQFSEYCLPEYVKAAETSFPDNSRQRNDFTIIPALPDIWKAFSPFFS